MHIASVRSPSSSPHPGTFDARARTRRALAASFGLVVAGACDCSEQLVPLGRTEPATIASDPRDAGETARPAPAEEEDAGPAVPSDEQDGGSRGTDAGPDPVVDAGTLPSVDAGPEPIVDAGVDDRPDAGFFSPPPDDVPVYEGPCGPVEIAPGYPAELWGDFQSVPGSGYQETITLTFPCPVRSVTVTIYDPDYPENEMVAYGEGDVVLDRVLFVGDQTPGFLTGDVKSVHTQSAPIVEVLLHPDPLDFVSYGDISYTAY
jgi:hypothetical protein